MHTPEIMHLYQLCRLGLSGTLLASVLFEELKITVSCKAMTLLWLPLGSSDARFFHESDTEIKCGVLDDKSFNQIFFTPTVELFTVLRDAEIVNVPFLAVLAGCSARRSERGVAGHTSEEQRRNAPVSAVENGILAVSASLKPEQPVLREIASVFPGIRPIMEQNENTLAITTVRLNERANR